MREQKASIPHLGRLINQSNRCILLLLLLFMGEYSFAGINYRTTTTITYDRLDGPVTYFLNDPANAVIITPTTGLNDTLFISDGDTLLIDNVTFDLSNFLLPVIIIIEDNDTSDEAGGMMHFQGGNSGLLINPGSDLFIDPLNLDGLMYSPLDGKGNGNALGKPVIEIWETEKFTVKELEEIIQAGGISLFLPVELVFFQAEAEDQMVRLYWQTAWEWDNSHFEVQHSKDGADFGTLAEVNGRGTTAFLSNYEYYHSPPTPGIQYYRLRQVDFDGSFAYSDVLAVNFAVSALLDFSIAPNPARQQLEILLSQIPQQTIKIVLTNPLGQTQSLNYEALGNSLQVALPAQLSTGLYWLQVYDGQERVSKPIVIQ